MDSIECYKNELLTIQVISRILNIEEKKYIKNILKKLNIKADLIKPTIGSLRSFYKIEHFLRADVVKELKSINTELNKINISSLLKKHIEMVAEIRKEEAKHTITIDPENEFELLKIKTKDKKEKQKQLDKENIIRVKNLYATTKSIYPKYNIKTKTPLKIKLSKEEEKKEKIRKVNNTRQNENKRFHINLRLRCNMSSRLNMAIKNGKKIDGTIKLLGCSIRECRKYLEEKFTEGMNWDNYGKHGWHIDHIIPCDAFDFRIKEAQEFCFNYKNLQPLWAKENIIKKDKIDFNYLIKIGINQEILKPRYRKQLLELINK
jgi:hypothetical protein